MPTFKRPFFAADERLGQARNGASPGRREPGPHICPRLGIATDPETAYNFAAELNHCYHVEPATSVQLHHQVTYCLSPNHSRCPIYRQQEVVVLPAKRHKRTGLRLWRPKASSPPRPPRQNRALLRLIPILFFVAAALLLAAGWYYRVGVAAWLPAEIRLPAAVNTPLLSPTRTLQSVMPPATDTPAATPSLTPTRTATPAPTATMRPSATATTTASPSPTLEAAVFLETAAVTATPSSAAPGCTPPDGWILYTVQPNDSLFRLGQRFGVPYVELQVANCMGSSKVIYAGQLLFVPDESATVTPGLTRPLPAETPPFSPWDIDE